MRRLWTLVKDESGQDLIEYGILGGFITLMVVTAAAALGNASSMLYAGVAGGVASVPIP